MNDGGAYGVAEDSDAPAGGVQVVVSVYDSDETNLNNGSNINTNGYRSCLRIRLPRM